MNAIGRIVILIIVLISISCDSEELKQPNIVIIYADDMGYGDLNCQNPMSKIPTPNLDKLASEGIRFTDAHSSSGICSPSRFALLTGTYHWRRQHQIVGAFGAPFFKDSDITLAQLLKANGYTTACIGKWHLGWDWQISNTPSGEVEQWGQNVDYFLPEDIEWDKAIGGGPLDRGFDYYFGDGTINFPPYAWMENDRFIEIPTETMDIHNVGHPVKEGFWEFRPGPKVKDWNPYNVLPTLTIRVVEWLGERNMEEPFFLYFALPSPHAPIIPNDEFDQKSSAGAYGDFMVQTDWVVGQVINALKDKGRENNTLIIFSSDNGPEAYAWERAQKYDHFSMGDYRGLKRDVWEGGHHVPFIIKWPGHVDPGSVSDELISQIDIMATLASIAGIDLPEGAAPDSYDFSSVLKGQEYISPIRETIVHNTYKDIWGVRKGDWLYLNDSTGGHRKMPISFQELRGYSNFITEGLLFNMEDDPEQRNNLFEQYPERIRELNELLEEYRKEGSSLK